MLLANSNYRPCPPIPPPSPHCPLSRHTPSKTEALCTTRKLLPTNLRGDGGGGSMGHVIEISQHSLRSHPLCLLVLLNLSVSDKDTIIRQSENIHISRNFGHLLCLTYRENKCYSCFNKTVVEICTSTTRLDFPFLIPKWRSLYQICDENHL